MNNDCAANIHQQVFSVLDRCSLRSQQIITSTNPLNSFFYRRKIFSGETMSPTLYGSHPTWESVEGTVKEYLSKICPRLLPKKTRPEAFQAGALKRARKTYEREVKYANPRLPHVWLWHFAIRTALDERRWLVGRAKYATAELEMYISTHLMQSWNLKSDIEKAMLHHARESDEGYRSCKSIKLLFWNRYSEEQLCRFWHDDYDVVHRNELQRLVDHDTDELLSLLAQLHIPLIKSPPGEGDVSQEARQVLEDIHGES